MFGSETLLLQAKHWKVDAERLRAQIFSEAEQENLAATKSNIWERSEAIQRERAKNFRPRRIQKTFALRNKILRAKGKNEEINENIETETNVKRRKKRFVRNDIRAVAVRPRFADVYNFKNLCV